MYVPRDWQAVSASGWASLCHLRHECGWRTRAAFDPSLAADDPRHGLRPAEVYAWHVCGETDPYWDPSPDYMAERVPELYVLPE
ncbi:hypothetical protein [Nonomuraea typhae]|uniref:Uncharacterized protein n=1 Tax=Nonomuraea typhae TaxID=2603600 RepID=A0ABW7YLU8_9ACTN